MEPARLFVYGTLRRGYTNEFAQLLHGNSRFLGTARLNARLQHLGNYTVAILSDRPDEWVPGELFELEDPGILKALDKYEGPDFERTAVSVALDLGAQFETWVYRLRKK